jgi:16S rRNA (adenine1518-N6/adenine1519-N6)-dimethyltransferase
VVRDAFAQRRKTIRNSLRDHVSDDMWTQLGIRSDLRAENISVPEFVKIANVCHEHKAGSSSS